MKRIVAHIELAPLPAVLRGRGSVSAGSVSLRFAGAGIAHELLCQRWIGEVLATAIEHWCEEPGAQFRSLR